MVIWGRESPELLITLDRGARLGRQVQDRLRDAIRDGRLALGERLPASRALAEQLGVSRGIVVDAYAQLESEGYRRSAQGAGTVVAFGAGEIATSAPWMATRRWDADFEVGVPDLREFPRRDWVWALGVAARTASPADLGDELGNGAAHLREALAAYLRRVRSAVVDRDAVVVCAGFRYGLRRSAHPTWLATA